MRELFISEHRYIRNMLLRYRNVEFLDYGLVLVEEHSSQHSPTRPRFNNDYMLQFVDDLRNFESCSSTVLPNTSGADVFVTFDKHTSRPLRTELLAGEAFPI